MSRHRHNRERADRDRRERRIRQKCLEEIQHLRRETNLVSVELPVQEVQADVEKSLQLNDALLFQASTGAGKSIDLPVFVARALPEANRIAVTQPRRDAAQGVCIASAARHGLEFGKDICYSTSEFKGNTADTKIQIQTTALLLNRFKKDPLLEYYDAVVVDEAHERDLHIDSVLALIKRANTLRSEHGMDPIKLVVASATIDEEKFQQYLGCDDSAVFNVEGRMYPVSEQFATKDETLYPLEQHEDADTERRPRPYTSVAIEKVNEIVQTTSQGDILVFMPGLRVINHVISELRHRVGREIEVLRLHGVDDMQHRSKVIKGGKPGAKRRIIVSTNMAETSVTVPNIRYVVDSCRKNEPTYDPETGLTALQEVAATKAECRQRRGRAGRVAEGAYYAVLTEAEFDELEDHPKPDIERLKLSSTVLKLLNMGITRIEDLSLLDQPPRKFVEDAIHELHILGVVDNKTDRNLTPFGEVVAGLPLEPRLAVVVAAAQEYGCLHEAIDMTAMMSRAAGVLRHRPDDQLTGWMRRISRNGEAQQSALTENERRAQLAGASEGDGRQQNKLSSERRLIEQLRRYDQAASSEAQRHIGKEWLQLQQAELRDKHASDWMLYLDVLEAYRRAPHRAQYCAENGLDQFLLDKALDNVASIERELERAGVDVSVSSTDPDKVTQAILRAYAPDHLIMNTGNRRGVEFSRLDRGDTSVRIGSSSASRNNVFKLAVALDLNPGKGRMSAGRKRGSVETTWKYALSVHPVTQRDLESAMPHLVKREDNNISHKIDSNGVVSTSILFSFKDRSGRWVPIGAESLEEAHPSATRYLANAIIEAGKRGSGSEVNRPEFNIERNAPIAQQLDQMAVRAQFVYAADDHNRFDTEMNDSDRGWTGLQEWYVQQIGKAFSVEQALASGSDFILSADGYYSSDFVSAIEQEAPVVIQLYEAECTITYAYRAGDSDSWYPDEQEDRYSITVHLNTIEPDVLLRLSEVELRDTLNKVIAVLDIEEDGDSITYSYEYGSTVISKDNLVELVDQIHTIHRKQEWKKWNRPEKQYVVFSEDKPWPEDIGQLGIRTLQYGESLSGEPLMSALALRVEQNYRTNSQAYYVEHHPTSDEAERAMRYNKQDHKRRYAERIAEEQIRLLLQPVQTKVEAISDLYDQVYSTFSVSGGRKRRIEQKLSLARGLVNNADSEDDLQHAMKLVDEIYVIVQKILRKQNRAMVSDALSRFEGLYSSEDSSNPNRPAGSNQSSVTEGIRDRTGSPFASIDRDALPATKAVSLERPTVSAKKPEQRTERGTPLAGEALRQALQRGTSPEPEIVVEDPVRQETVRNLSEADRTIFMDQLSPLRVQLELMAELGASVQRLSERLSKIERRVQNATGRKKIAKEVPNTVDEISKLILDVVNRYGWPPTWQQRYSTMIEQIIPTTENLYDPEEDRADMLAAIVLNPDVADADLEAEFLSYYGG